jgi:hypothetical protein
LFPPWGKVLGKLSKQKDLKIYETRVKDEYVQVFIEKIKS